MAVYKRGYERYTGERLGHFRRFMVLPRYAWARLLEQRLVVILLAVAMLWPLICGGFIYVANHLDLIKNIGGGGAAKMLQINGKFFLVFMNVQAVFGLLLAALTGPGLVAPDLANNALPLYFSRPLTRFDYVAARMTVLAGLLSFVTWIPGLVLFTIQSGMAGWSWGFGHWEYALGVFAGFWMWIVIVSLVALASSAYVKWKIVAGALVLGFFFLTAGMAEMINGVLRVQWGMLVNPVKVLYTLWCEMLWVEPPEGPGAWECTASAVALVLVLGWILERKLRPVEVVS